MQENKFLRLFAVLLMLFNGTPLFMGYLVENKMVTFLPQPEDQNTPVAEGGKNIRGTPDAEPTQGDDNNTTTTDATPAPAPQSEGEGLKPEGDAQLPKGTQGTNGNLPETTEGSSPEAGESDRTGERQNDAQEVNTDGQPTDTPKAAHESGSSEGNVTQPGGPKVVSPPESANAPSGGSSEQQEGENQQEAQSAGNGERELDSGDSVGTGNGGTAQTVGDSVGSNNVTGELGDQRQATASTGGDDGKADRSATNGGTQASGTETSHQAGGGNVSTGESGNNGVGGGSSGNVEGATSQEQATNSQPVQSPQSSTEGKPDNGTPDNQDQVESKEDESKGQTQDGASTDVQNAS